LRRFIPLPTSDPPKFAYKGSGEPPKKEDLKNFYLQINLKNNQQQKATNIFNDEKSSMHFVTRQVL
jgi:hypothetical protein